MPLNMHTNTHTLTSLSRPEFDSVSLVPATALWSEWTVCGESVFGTDTMVPSSDTWDFSVSLSMPAGNHESQETNHHFKDKMRIKIFYIFLIIFLKSKTKTKNELIIEVLSVYPKLDIS